MRLYIPTCTLNFNNILTTESFSPEAFYSNRVFGNKRYYPVKANGLVDCILLYSKYPLYEVSSSDMENYPLVIEVETEDYPNPNDKFKLQTSSNGVNVYSCFDTIYLNPFHCHFYFSNKEALLYVSTLAEQSLENKFYDVYSGCLSVRVEKSSTNGTLSFESDNLNEFKWDESFVPRNVNPSPAYCEVDDALLDRVKGFLYCYLIGSNTTLSKEASDLRSISRNLLNTLSSVLNSPSGQPSDVQDKALCDYIKAFESIFSEVDEASASNKKKIDVFLSENPHGLSVEVLRDTFNYFGVTPNYSQKLRLSPVFDVKDLWSCLEDKSIEAYNRFSDRLEKAVSAIETKELSKASKHAVHELVEIGDGFTIQINDLQKKEFYEKLIASQVRLEYKSKVGEYGEQLALVLNGGGILKNLMQEKWENSTTRVFVNQLLSHFQCNSPFDIFSYEKSIIVQSFALFCLKGENVDKLLDYAQKIGIGNVQFALGLCGATYGFASLPKTFTSQLINGDRDYYRDFYIAVYKDLFGVDLKDAEFISNECNMSDIESSSKLVSANLSYASTKNSLIRTCDFMREFEKSSKRTNAFKALAGEGFDKDDSWLSVEICESKVMNVVQPKLPKKDKDKNVLLSKIKEAISKAKQPLENANVSEVRSENCGRKTIIDDVASVCCIIGKCDELGTYKSEVVNLFKSFQREYNNGGYYYAHPETYRRDSNEKLIEHFVCFCLSPKTNNGPIIPRKAMEALKRMLLEAYTSHFK